MELNFSNGVAHPDGVLLGSSTPLATVSPTGAFNFGSSVNNVPVTISLIKTGEFGSGYGMGANNIRFPDGLGSMQYYSSTDPGVKSSSINVINFPDTYGLGGTDSHYLAAVGTPYCEVLTLGNASLVAASPAVIQLSSVSSSAFSGIGAIDSGSSTRKFRFACHGTDETQPKVYFNATYPLGGSVNGVGMPSADSDIGIQILLNNVPVEFETYSSPLQWTKNAYAPYNPKEGGTYLASGYYCLKECGTSMTGANWIDGEVGTGNNDDIDVNVTFKYYQTTDARPAPSQFSVPFTVTLDVP
ncbi:hypothetical protein [Pseudomonas turukhanskensis]|uniref:hypothetical protein n=1 Tax=Pseudomonas turukhanskensis TaxID=1806536 RepID=UPI0022F2B40D|nr:hypothetical protein [Pseudomonas turukhanskensis]